MAFSSIENGVYKTQVNARHARGNRMRAFYFSSLIVAMLVLLALLYNIVNGAFGLVATDFETDPAELADVPLEELSNEELMHIILDDNEASGQLIVLIHSNLSDLGEPRAMSGVPLNEALRDDVTIPEGQAELPINDLSNEERANLLAINLSQQEMVDIVYQEVVKEEVLDSWELIDSLLNRSEIEATVEERYPGANLEMRSWLSLDFITDGLSRTPGITGIYPAFVGTILLLIFTTLFAFPVGVGAALYLEEYAADEWYNRIIELNIRNLAGVPSIIYGMLGLAIFVRALEVITSGDALGAPSANGRTIISASLTLGLLILPIIITGTQEALRSVPQAYREASYGLGATKWQTISRQILPAALPGILTGTIIAISRAIGETAPIIVVGAATFINTTPDGPFSQFTALPILIYNWTTQPNPQFQNAASAAIIVLLALLLTMNSIAIILRNRASRNF